MLEDPDLVNLYNEATVFACPSIYEPFGIINLEAMACETPVVAAAVGGIKEVVVDGETGLLVPPADPPKLARALTKVLEDPALAAKMGRAGRARVLQDFTWGRIAEKTLALYRSLT
jgi:starch synthase